MENREMEINYIFFLQVNNNLNMVVAVKNKVHPHIAAKWASPFKMINIYITATTTTLENSAGANDYKFMKRNREVEDSRRILHDIITR